MSFLNSKKIKLLLIGQLIVFIFLLSSTTLAVQSSTNTNFPTSSPNLTNSQITQQMQNANIVAIYDKNAATNIKVDGVISPNEYPETFHSAYTGMNVSVAYNGTQMFIGLQAPTINGQGYAAIGFNRLGYGMIGADIKAGWVNSTGGTEAYDYYATQYNTPSRDPSGHNDVVEAKGIDNNATNTLSLEMVINMVSKNATDYTKIVPGVAPSTGITADIPLYVNNSYSMLLAWGPTDYVSYHYRKELATIFIAPKNIQARTATQLNMKWIGVTNGTQNTNFMANVTLTDANGNPIRNATVGMYEESLIADTQLVTATTNSQGVATFNFTFLMQYSSQVKLRAKYLGDIQYKKSDSLSQIVTYTGSVPVEQAPFLLIPLDMDYIVPWLTGIGAIATVAFMWTMFGYVIYSVVYKNALEPDGKKV